MDDPTQNEIKPVKKAQRLVFYMNNIRKIDPSFHRELKFMRDEQTKQIHPHDYLKVTQVIKHMLQFS